MMNTRMRVYDAGRFHEVDLPPWYLEAERLSQTKKFERYAAFEEALDCDCMYLTDDSLTADAFEIRYWPSEEHGIFVLIETQLGLVEQIIVLNPAEWMPFLSRYLAPLMATSIQNAMLVVHRKLANAFVAWARHGEGHHVDIGTGQSWVDLDNEQRQREAAQARAARAKAGCGDGK
jgi:hypothetical protein